MAYDLAIIVGLVGIAFVFIYLAMNMSREKLTTAGLQILFLSLGMFTMLIGVNAMAMAAEDAGQADIANILYGLYGIILYAVILIIALIIITIVAEAAGVSLEYAKKMEDD